MISKAEIEADIDEAGRMHLAVSDDPSLLGNPDVKELFVRLAFHSSWFFEKILKDWKNRKIKIGDFKKAVKAEAKALELEEEKAEAKQKAAEKAEKEKREAERAEEAKKKAQAKPEPEAARKDDASDGKKTDDADDGPGVYIFEPKHPEKGYTERVGTIGVVDGNWTVRRLARGEEDENGKPTQSLAWVSDCALYIHTETRAKEDTEFTFVGKGARDGRRVKFTMQAKDLAGPRKFKAALINAFGSQNQVGKLKFEDVQSMSINTIVMERVEVPYWKGKVPMLPGVDLVKNVEYKLSEKVPAQVYDDDLDLAKEELKRLLEFHKYAPLVVCTVFAAPAVARWHKEKRFFLALWGGTGSWKTTFTLLTIGIYGLKFTEEPLLKANKEGSTAVGAEEVFAASGFLPVLYDNLKTTDPKNTQNYINVIHMVVEGSEKARGAKDGGLKPSKEFSCIPLVTGEIRPGESSTTARGLNIVWNRADADQKVLTEAQNYMGFLPILGYRWLRFLAETKDVLCPDFDTKRSAKVQELAQLGYDNPGRPATNATLLEGTWDLLEKSPFGSVFKEYRDKFNAALDEVTGANAETVMDESEVAKFIRAVEQLIAANPSYISGMNSSSAEDVPVGGRQRVTLIGKLISTHTDEEGKKIPDGIWLLPETTLAEVSKLKVFTQIPDAASISQALKARDLLLQDKDDHHLMTVRRINGVSHRGWLIKWDAFKFDRVVTEESPKENPVVTE